MMDFSIRTHSFAAGMALLAATSPSWSEPGPQLSTCTADSKAPACAGMRGDRRGSYYGAGSDHRKDGQAVEW
jgi:hypothetical protein